ncbi:MAG: folate-binding protein YgfZ [Robiginitomaculum sp.]|nr:MAG: folate-binding protein YgfZ [Robiginitomaculum sp.]
MPIAQLDRTVLSLKGETVCEFLNGLITNSLSDTLTFAALLTPQGKIIADFFIHKQSCTHLLIETPAKFGKALMTRLKMYKLRAQITIEDVSDTHTVYAFWNGEGDVGHPDPRHTDLGHRLITDDLLSVEHEANDYDLHRLALAIPDSIWDFDSEQVFPSDTNMDKLHGIDYKKGCFIGQEVASRMHRKTEVRKRMRGIKLSGSAQIGDDLMAGTRKIGTVKHVNRDYGIALIRLDRLAQIQDAVTLNDSPVTIMEPPYGHTP